VEFAMNDSNEEILQHPAHNAAIAGMGRRSLAGAIDLGVAFAVCMAAVRMWGVETSPSHWSLTGLPALLVMLGIWCYWFLPEWIWGTSLGKFMCDLKVVSENGGKCSAAQAFKRNLLRVVDFWLFYLIGFLVAKFSPRHQRLGDQWAKTLVVRTEKLNAAVGSESTSN
jgi:uncharacterized RDD family membrane protein YckC